MATENMEHLTNDEELDAYQKMRQRVSKTFSDLQGRLNVENINQAIDKTITELKETGEHSMEVINKASAALKKDIASTTNSLKPKVTDFTEEAKTQFNNLLDKGGALWHDIVQEAEHVQEYSRDKGGAFLSNVIRGLSEWGKIFSEKPDSCFLSPVSFLFQPVPVSDHFRQIPRGRISAHSQAAKAELAVSSAPSPARRPTSCPTAAPFRWSSSRRLRDVSRSRRASLSRRGALAA